MRAPSLRFTIRGLMVGIAIVAFAIWSWGVVQRRVTCLRRAGEYARKEQADLTWAMDAERTEGWRDWSDHFRQSAATNGRLRRKYERAASRPWLPIVLDPDEFRYRIYPSGPVREGLVVE